jgi:acyl carrier protein
MNMAGFAENEFLEIVRRNIKPAYRRAVRLDAELRADLDLDSIGVIAIMMVIEQETKLPVFELDPAIGEVTTLRDLMHLITRHNRA